MKEAEVRKEIEKVGWEAFTFWMRGQTVSGYEDGTTNYYRHDVEDFLRQLKAAAKSFVVYD